MKLGIYSVYDAAAEAFLRPFFAPNDKLAIRAFADTVADPTHDFARHHADYTLFRLGEFDQSSGKITVEPTPKNLGLATTYLVRSDDNG